MKRNESINLSTATALAMLWCIFYLFILFGFRDAVVAQNVGIEEIDAWVTAFQLSWWILFIGIICSLVSPFVYIVVRDKRSKDRKPNAFDVMVGLD